MRRLSFVIVALICSSAAIAGDNTERLNFETHGFSICPLEDDAQNDAYQALIMLLPPSDGFAPNINVQIQPYKNSIKDYVKLSKKQFEEGQFTLIKDTSSDDSAIFEFSGKSEGKNLHFYAKAELVEGKVYLATGTSTESQWKKVGPKLKASTDSFKANKGKTDDLKKAKPVESKAKKG